MKDTFKRVLFTLIVITLVLIVGVVIKNGKFDKLEGYLYSLASEITTSATESNATSSDADYDDITSSDIYYNATSSDADYDDATSSDVDYDNATSTNATTKITIKVKNIETSQDEVITENKEVVINEEVHTKLSYNNSEITKDILYKISNTEETQAISITLDKNVNISKEIFEAVKGKNVELTINVGENQIIFYGNDIKNPKDIDASISYNLSSDDRILKEIVQDAVIINFANNGILPGQAKVRIKVTDEIKSVINLEKIFVYHYNEETNELEKMEKNACYTEDGYIEMTINHNSKYIFVNEIIEEKEYTVTTNGNAKVKEDVSFLESNKMYIMIIIASLIIITIVVIILILDKKEQAKKKVEENNIK